jgi:hypothetical protein
MTQMPPFPSARLIAASAMLIALCACSYADEDEVDAESAAILTSVPIDTAFDDLPAAMRALGFSCTPGRKQFTDAKGNVRDAEAHLSCIREQAYWLVCKKRTRAILLQLSGRLSNILVNVGHFCA